MLVTLLTLSHGLIPLDFELLIQWYLITRQGSTKEEAERNLKRKGFVVDDIALVIKGREIIVTGAVYFHRSVERRVKQLAIA